jgi:hypothetical protein
MSKFSRQAVILCRFRLRTKSGLQKSSESVKMYSTCSRKSVDLPWGGTHTFDNEWSGRGNRLSTIRKAMRS